MVNVRVAPCAHIVDQTRSGVAVRGVGGSGSELRLVLCSIVMLLFRPLSYGHRANPEFADLSSRSLRNADGRCRCSWMVVWNWSRLISPRRSDEVCLAIIARVGEPSLLPNSITPIADHSLNVFFLCYQGSRLERA